MSDNFDGGPAFPGLERGAGGLELTCPGMSKRELFAAILMHSEAVTCGVPGEAADALVQAADVAGRDVIDHMAMNAVEGADALLRALAEPRPEPAPRFPEFNVYGASDAQRDALHTLHTRTWFDRLPDALRTYVTDAVDAIARNETGEDDILF
jgi:hypothetical protein